LTSVSKQRGKRYFANAKYYKYYTVTLQGRRLVVCDICEALSFRQSRWTENAIRKIWTPVFS